MKQTQLSLILLGLVIFASLVACDKVAPEAKDGNLTHKEFKGPKDPIEERAPREDHVLLSEEDRKEFHDKLKESFKDVKDYLNQKKDAAKKKVKEGAKEAYSGLSDEKKTHIKDGVKKTSDKINNAFSNLHSMDPEDLKITMSFETNEIVIEEWTEDAEGNEVINTISIYFEDDEEAVASEEEEVKETLVVASENPSVVEEKTVPLAEEKVVPVTEEKTVVEEVPAAQQEEEKTQVVTPTEEIVITEEKTTAPLTEESPKVKAEETPALTEEEELEIQRDIAFKVVFFFIAFIALCFGLLYAYHKMQQQSEPKVVQNKANFYDFLAGQLDDEFPVAPIGRYVR